MTDQNQTLREDIAFMRGLAEAGLDRPMLGGAILFACGLIFGAASLVVWWLAAVAGMDGWMYSAVWGSSFVIYMATLAVLLRRMPRTAAPNQAAAGAAWSGVGWAIFFIGVSFGVLSWRLRIPDLMLAFPSVLMALYGAAWFTASVAFRQRWMMLVGAASFVMAPVTAWLATGHAVWLVYGLSLLALLSAPGLHLMRQGRRAG